MRMVKLNKGSLSKLIICQKAKSQEWGSNRDLYGKKTTINYRC